MTATYHLNESELDESFFQQVKTFFKNKKLTITIEDEIDESEYLLSSIANRTHLEKSIKDIEEGRSISFSLNEFQGKYGNV